MSLFGSSSNNNSGDEHVIANPPDDTVSRLRFNPNPQNGQQFICSGSWANDVRIWQIATQQQSSGMKKPKLYPNLTLIYPRLIPSFTKISPNPNPNLTQSLPDPKVKFHF